MSAERDLDRHGILGAEYGASVVESPSGGDEIMDQTSERKRKQMPDTEILGPDLKLGPEEPCGDTLIIKNSESGEDSPGLNPSTDATQVNGADNRKVPVYDGSLPHPAFLEIAYHDGRKEVYPLNLGKTTIGRKEYNDIVLEDPEQFISRQHVYIISRQGRYFVADTNSCNGTRLQGKEIKGMGEVPLNEGDTIEIEGLELILRFRQVS
jgi:hypothetical protein